jgi:hypothetical protein
MTPGLLHATPRTRPLPEPISLNEAVRLSRLAREEREGRPGFVQGTLAVDFAAASDESLFGPQRTVRENLPDPAVWAGRITHALLEVMMGLRPAPQVVRWTTPDVYAVIARRGALASRRSAQGHVPRRRERLRVVRVRVCEPADGVAEAAVVVQHGSTVRAVAIRLEGQDGKWRISALQIG